MAKRQCLMVRIRRTSSFTPLMTISEVAFHAGVHPDLIDRFVRLGLIDFDEIAADGERFFRDEVVLSVKRILRLRNELGINYAGIGVILELVATIESLENRIREMDQYLRARE
jgi:MerR family transcriptional regulator, heat shock protein HspR